MPEENIMLTAGQHKTLKFIRKYIDRHSYSPTLSEIASGRGLSSKGSMHRDVQALAAGGYLKLLPGRKRGIQLIDEPGQAASTLPLLGRIAAGKPIEAIPDQETVNLTDFVMGQNRYCLLVMGDSMTGIGILDGDTVIVEGRQTANDDDIVVALIDNEDATLKRFKNRRDGTIELIPENPDMPTMIYTADRVYGPLFWSI
jgi:repressor LexA